MCARDSSCIVKTSTIIPLCNIAVPIIQSFNWSKTGNRSILIFIVCALLILIVLVQNSKGGGLSSSFASSNQIMGVRKTTDFLEKATWTLAGAMLVLCIVSAMVLPRGEQAGKQSAIQEQINTAAPGTQAIPDFGTMNNNNTTTTTGEENNTTSQEQE